MQRNRRRSKKNQTTKLATATGTFTKLPVEVQVMIGPYLTPHDLTCCVRVNKTWSAIFNPFLWKHIAEPAPAPPRHNVRDQVARRRAETWTEIFLRCCSMGAETGVAPLERHKDLIQSIKFDECSDEFFEEFLDLCPDYLPHLSSAEISGLQSDDDTISRFLDLTVDGWKRLVFRLEDSDYLLGVGLHFMETLQDHAETLEVVRIEAKIENYFGGSLQILLCAAPLLKELYVIPPSRKTLEEPCQIPAWIIANDLANGREWACTELEVFGCQIGEIPRLDITREIHDQPARMFTFTGTAQEGFEMQQDVYRQLGRMHKLRQLTLGIHFDTHHETYSSKDKEYFRQYDGLAMTLDSGLDLLKDLKNLEVVNLEDMEVYIDGDKEQAWIAEHWPNVRIVSNGYETEQDYLTDDEGEDDELVEFYTWDGIPFGLDSDHEVDYFSDGYDDGEYGFYAETEAAYEDMWFNSD